MLNERNGKPGGRSPRRRRRSICRALTCLVLFAAFLAVPGGAAAGPTLGQPGYLVLAAARDTSAGFHWESGPTAGHLTLVWDQGRLIVPDSLQVEDSGPFDLGLAVTADLAGSGASGHLVLADGVFPVSEPVILADGIITLELTAGELAIRGARLRYRRVAAEPPDNRAGLLLLAGMSLMIFVLLRRARKKVGERTSS